MSNDRPDRIEVDEVFPTQFIDSLNTILPLETDPIQNKIDYLQNPAVVGLVVGSMEYLFVVNMGHDISDRSLSLRSINPYHGAGDLFLPDLLEVDGGRIVTTRYVGKNETEVVPRGRLSDLNAASPDSPISTPFESEINDLRQLLG